MTTKPLIITISAMVIIMMLSFIGIASAATFTNYTCYPNTTSIYVTFDTDMKGYDFYYNNELILYDISHEVFAPDLEPDTDYSVVIADSATDEIQIITCHTLAESQDEFYLQYGLIGLLLLIIMCLFISTKIHTIALISLLLSFVGFGYCAANEYGFITTFIFVVLLVISMIAYARGD